VFKAGLMLTLMRTVTRRWFGLLSKAGVSPLRPRTVAIG
jgi:hypothetical protein